MGTVGKAQLLETVAAERTFWERLLAEVGEERMLQPGAAGDWTFKDVAAHIAAWRRRTLARLEAARRKEPLPPEEWPADEEDLDKINAWLYQRNRDRPLAEVLAESRLQFDDLAAVVAALSEEDLTQPGRIDWMWDNLPLGVLVGYTFAHLHDEHMPAIRAWLERWARPNTS